MKRGWSTVIYIIVSANDFLLTALTALIDGALHNDLVWCRSDFQQFIELEINSHWLLSREHPIQQLYDLFPLSGPDATVFLEMES